MGPRACFYSGAGICLLRTLALGRRGTESCLRLWDASRQWPSMQGAAPLLARLSRAMGKVVFWELLSKDKATHPSRCDLVVVLLLLGPSGSGHSPPLWP